MGSWEPTTGLHPCFLLRHEKIWSIFTEKTANNRRENGLKSEWHREKPRRRKEKAFKSSPCAGLKLEDAFLSFVRERGERTEPMFGKTVVEQCIDRHTHTHTLPDRKPGELHKLFLHTHTFYLEVWGKQQRQHWQHKQGAERSMCKTKETLHTGSRYRVTSGQCWWQRTGQLYILMLYTDASVPLNNHHSCLWSVRSLCFFK